jgi:glycosyltransferase involved in cell wall biosynthesis
MRILLVSYYFPPFNSVGAVRPGKLARFLHAQGHEVQVLTCSNQPYPQGLPLELPAQQVAATAAWSVNAPIEWALGGREKVAREGFAGGAPRSSLVRRLGYLYRTLLHWPDAQAGWVSGALRRGRTLLEGQRFDLIYASAPPFSVLKVAARLARESGVPWVAELRDLWTDNHGYAYPAWRRALERRAESALLRSASALVTVSQPLAQKLRTHGKPVWEVRNGCDAEDFEDLPAPAGAGADAEADTPGDGLAIVFTGNVYPGHYDVQAFCEGLALFLQQGGKATVQVAGRNTAALQQAAQQAGLAGVFRFQSTVARLQALALQKHADVLLFFVWGGDAGEGVFSLKLFEYAGARRPVLAVGPAATDVARLVVDAGLGTVCEQAAAVAAQLHALQQEKQRTGRLQRPGRPGFDLSRRTQFLQLERRLAALLQEGA